MAVFDLETERSPTAIAFAIGAALIKAILVLWLTTRFLFEDLLSHAILCGGVLLYEAVTTSASDNLRVAIAFHKPTWQGLVAVRPRLGQGASPVAEPEGPNQPVLPDDQLSDELSQLNAAQALVGNRLVVAALASWFATGAALIALLVALVRDWSTSVPHVGRIAFIGGSVLVAWVALMLAHFALNEIFGKPAKRGRRIARRVHDLGIQIMLEGLAEAHGLDSSPKFDVGGTRLAIRFEAEHGKMSEAEILYGDDLVFRMTFFDDGSPHISIFKEGPWIDALRSVSGGRTAAA